MSLAWHIARKDLFRLRYLLLFWAVVITGHVAFATLHSALNPAAAMLCYVLALIFGFIFLPAFCLGLPMGVLHDDSTADTDAFWVTRPISGGQLLAAKVIVLITLAFLPALVTAPWWFACGYDFSQLVSATLHTARWNASLMLLAVALASMSRSVARFIMSACVAALLFLFLAVFVEPVLAAGHVFSASPLGPDAWPRFMARSWIVVTIVILLNQFLRRRTRHSLAIAVAGFVLAVALSLVAKASPSVATRGTAPDATPRLEAIVNPVAGSGSHRNGATERVVEAALDGNRYVVVVTEATPDFSYPAWMNAPDPAHPGTGESLPSGTAQVQPGRKESYFLVHRHDGRSLRATAGRAEDRLVAATLRHSRRELVFPAPEEWQRDPSFSFNAWIKDTVLVKLSAPTDLAAPPRDLLPSDLLAP